MAILKLAGIPPYDGDYEIPEKFTNGEYHRIKQISGVTAGRLAEAMADGDIGAIVAITAVILERAGKQVNEQALWDANFNENFDWTQDDAEEDVGRPPVTATSGGSKNEPGAVAKPTPPMRPSGSNGAADGDPSPATPLITGSPGSVERAESSPMTSPV